MAVIREIRLTEAREGGYGWPEKASQAPPDREIDDPLWRKACAFLQIAEKACAGSLPSDAAAWTAWILRVRPRVVLRRYGEDIRTMRHEWGPCEIEAQVIDATLTCGDPVAAYDSHLARAEHPMPFAVFIRCLADMKHPELAVVLEAARKRRSLRWESLDLFSPVSPSTGSVFVFYRLLLEKLIPSALGRGSGPTGNAPEWRGRPPDTSGTSAC